MVVQTIAATKHNELNTEPSSTAEKSKTGFYAVPFQSHSTSEQRREETTRLLRRELFYDPYGRPKKIPLGVAQLQVLLEDKAFYWEVAQSLDNLAKEGVLSRVEQITQYASTAVFYYPTEIAQNESQLALVKKHVFSITKLIDSYSEPRITQAIGKHLEGLVKYELKVQGFKIVGQNARSYKGKEWTRTAHNLDFVAEHENSSLAIGVEVKNTLGVIDRSEVEVKIDICRHLGILPVFAVRWIGPHYELVTSNHGYPWIFKTQMYPPGFEDLVQDIYKRLSLNWNDREKNFDYKMPITIRTELPQRPVEKFKTWVASAR